MNEMNDRVCFVPFCSEVIWRYKGMRELPGHDSMKKGLHSGEIYVTLTARSPICVAGSKRWKGVASFAKNAQGRYCIPGSTLRGLIRHNMQILGLGTVSVFEEIERGPMANGKMASAGLPRSYTVPDNLCLDYPRAMMGFVRKINGKNECYRSRISVGTLTALGAPKELNTWPVNQRRPMVDSEKFICREKDGSFRLSGTRQYPIKPAAPDGGYGTTQAIRPLDAGTRFSGSIRYRNLAADELGLLLWCLRLEQGCVHTIGMAKSYGCGQVEVSIDRLVEYDAARLYGSLDACGTVPGDTQQRVAELIAGYQAYAGSQIGGKELMQMPHIKEFLRLKRGLEQEEKSAPAPVPKEKIRKKDIKPQASAAEVSDMRAQLSSWFKKN